MIYEFPEPTAPIRQGDVFSSLPTLDLSLRKLAIVGDNVQGEVDWLDISANKETTFVVVPVRPVMAIVATQDCDAVRSKDITLCEIGRFRDVYPVCKDTTAPKKWVDVITQHARKNLKWFYLPIDDRMGFDQKMAVDFMATLRYPREDLEGLRMLRIGRLNPVADEHFRERIGEFFRRYPYDEWYPLDKQELDNYRRRNSGVEPYHWQQ